MTMFQRSTVSNLKRYKEPKKNPLAKDVNTKHECVTIMRVKKECLDGAAIRPECLNGQEIKQECLEQHKHRQIVVVDAVLPR